MSDFIVWKWFVWGDFYDRIIIKDLVLYNFNLSCFFQTRTTINWAPHRISINQHLFEHSTDASSSIIITIIIIIVPCRMCYMWVHWRKDLLIFVCACTKQSFAFFWLRSAVELILDSWCYTNSTLEIKVNGRKAGEHAWYIILYMPILLSLKLQKRSCKNKFDFLAIIRIFLFSSNRYFSRV